MESPGPTPPPPSPKTPGSGTAQPIDEKTIVSDLSGSPGPAGKPAEKTIVSDLSGVPQLTSSALQDTQVTQVKAAGMPAAPTGITQLHIESDPARNAAGTHRGEEWGDFRIGELLGRGGMGAVYKGLQLSLDRPVAIKVLPQELSLNESFRNRFQLEAKAVAKLSAPNVIQVYAAGVHLGKHYFAMEYVEGKDLSARMRAGFKPTPSEALELTLQAARGLAAAGELGIVHRDIKPANMMLTSRGVLKLMDFGLVKIASEDHSMTMSGTIMGTVSYFSPEQGRGDRCDQRTDIYALGVVFYEMLSGQLPFSGGDASAIIYQHLHAKPKALRELDPSIPEGFQAVVDHCMQKQAEDRYQDAGALVQDLLDLSQGRPPRLAAAAAGAKPAHAASGSAGRHWKLIAVGVGVLVLGVGIAVSLHAGGQHAPAAADAADHAASSAAPGPTTTNALATATTPASGTAGEGPPPRDAGALGTSATPTPGTAALSPTADQAVPDVEQALSLVRAGKLDEARHLADHVLQGAPGNVQWMQASSSIDAARGAHALEGVKQALAGNDLDSAATALAQAQVLLGEVPLVQEQERRLATLQQSRKARADRLATAENLFANGDTAKAQEALTALDAEQPGDPAVTNLLARVHAAATKAAQISSAASEQLRNADQAMAQKDYDAALLSYTAVKQLDPTSAAASTGLDRISKIKGQISDERMVFDKALSANDLNGATTALATLRDLAPGSPTLAVAENQLSTAKMSSERSQRDNEARDAKLTADAQNLLKRLDNPKEPLPELEKAAAALLASMDPGRADRTLIERRLEDRRSSELFLSELGKLDAGVLKGDATVIRSLVSDGAFADSLLQLKSYQGLVFESHLVEFQRHDRDATASVTIRNAMDLAPERILNYTYDLRRDTDATWQIVAAHLQQ